jgi:hypothetical protein
MNIFSLYRRSRQKPSVILYPDFASGYNALVRERFFAANELLKDYQGFDSTGKNHG